MIVTIVCLPGVADAEAVKLGGDEIREAVTGSLLELDTPLGTTIPIRFTGDGLMTGKAGQLSSVLGAAKDRGRWWVKGDRLCYKWFRWFEAQSQCMTVQMKDERVYWHQDDGKRGTATIVERAVVVAQEPKKSVQEPAERSKAPVPVTASARAAVIEAPPSEALGLSTAAIVPPVLKSPPRLAVRRKSPVAELGMASADMPDRGLFFVGLGLSRALQSQVRQANLAEAETPPLMGANPAPKQAVVQDVTKTPAVSPAKKTARAVVASLPVRKAGPVTPAQSAQEAVRTPPAASSTFSVYGVPAWDVLNVRSGPSSEHAIVGNIPSNGRGVRMVGPCIDLWCQVQFQNRRGWVNRYYLLAQN